MALSLQASRVCVDLFFAALKKKKDGLQQENNGISGSH
jgi:hypothetical protein